jgi:pyochelin biosynthesis protein PchD
MFERGGAMTSESQAELHVRFPVDGVTYPPKIRATASYANGAWIASNLGDRLRGVASQFPDRPAYISEEREITFRELDEASERLGAALINQGLDPGDRAIFQLGTTIETCVALYACYKAGIIPVCSLPQHREVEIGQLTKQSGARGYFVQADFSAFDLVGFAHEMLRQHSSLSLLVVARGGPGGTSMDALIDSVTLEEAKARLAVIQPGCEDVLAFQLSGGTTGVPKIIPRFHAEYLGHSAAWMRTYNIDADSRLIWSLPLLHNAGQLYGMIPAALLGLTIVLMSKADVQRILELVEKHRITHALSIGPIAPQLLAYQNIKAHDLSSLKLFVTMSRADKLEAHINVPCSNLYGITEGLLLGSSAEDPSFLRQRTQGRQCCAYDEIRLLDPESEDPVDFGQMGELCFRGPSTVTGFFNAPEVNATAFTSDGFYRTGDMMTAHVHEGIPCYAFEGRLRDNINRGGEKIGCEEVEGFVSQHPSVADAKLVPMPDPVYGEKACVFIIARPGMPVPDVKSLLTFLIDRGLAKYKCPERIEIIDSFPLTRVGKLDKPALKRQIAEMLLAEQKNP